MGRDGVTHCKDQQFQGKFTQLYSVVVPYSENNGRFSLEFLLAGLEHHAAPRLSYEFQVRRKGVREWPEAGSGGHLKK